jgi:citrate lyase subunit beta/citryl-CoA lyase
MNGSSRRSILAVPGSSEKMVLKSTNLNADQVFFDWEDAVAPDQKQQAREIVHDALKSELKFRTNYLSIRINSATSNWFEQDLQAISKLNLSRIFSVVLPKVENLEMATQVSNQLEQIELKSGIEVGTVLIDAQIESAKGLLNAAQIASHSRVSSLSFGPLDFLADIGVPWTTPSISNSNSAVENLLQHALIETVIAAKANGKMAFDGPVVEVHDPAIFSASAAISRSLGFDGKWVLHPDQISQCNLVFTPSEEEYQKALSIVSKYEAAISDQANSTGAMLADNMMIDEASIKLAQRTIARFQAFKPNP